GLTDVDKLYVDLRSSVTLVGEAVAPRAGSTRPGMIGKVMNMKLDQNVVGCHRGGATARDCNDLEIATVAGFSPSVTQSMNSGSTYIAVPLDADATCD